MHYACIHNDLSALKYFSRKKQSYNKRDKNNCTPLNICVKLGHVKLLKFIVEELKMRYDESYMVTLSHQSSSVDIAKSTLQDKLESDHSDTHGNSLLHIACMLGHIHIVEYLTREIGCDPNRINKIGMSCISITVKYKQIGILKYLLDNFPCDLNLLDSQGKSPIFLAAENGLLDALKYFQGKLPSGKVFFQQCHMDSNKNNILHAASAHSFVEVAQYCIEELNFDIASTNSDGKSCLHLCVEHGHLEVLRYLLDNTESDITLMDGNGKTPMELATDSGNFQIFKCLAQKSRDGNLKVTKTSQKEIFPICGYEKCLLSACAFGHLDIVRYLVEQMLCDTNCTNKQGMACLHLAAKHGRSEIVQYLNEDTSADLAAVDIDSKSPAFIAAEAGHFGVLKYIVDNNKGCASFKTSKQTVLGGVNYAPGCSLLHAASHGGHIQILEYLIQSCGCDYSCTDDVGIYPLYLACLMEQFEIADFLLDKFRCDPNRSIFNGRTCLHAACTSGSYNFLIKLVNRHGCDHDSADNEGITPLFIACELGCIAIAKILIEEKECDVTHKRNDGKSYLHAASSGGNLEIVQLLVDDFNLEPDCMDNAGTTPLYIASEKGHLEVTKYFIAGKLCELTKESIFVAERSKNTKVLKFLNDQYSILYNKSDWNHDQNSQSCTYVHKLSRQMERLDLIRYHVKHHHCIVNCKDDDGKTPLFYACQSGDLDVVKYLISEQNCDPNLVVKDYTCLRVACEKGKLNIVKFLYENYKCQQTLKCTTLIGNKLCEERSGEYLHYAAASGDIDTIEYFIKKGIAPNNQYCTEVQFSDLREYQNCTIPHTEKPANYKFKFKKNPLIAALYNGHLKATKIFIENYDALKSTNVSIIGSESWLGYLHILQYLVEDRKMNPDLVCTDKLSPLYVACWNGHLNVVKYLIVERCCKVNFIYPEGWNAIHVASKFGKLKIVKFLKEDCATEANNRDARGRTPLFLASLSGQTEVLKYLAAYHWDPSYVTDDGFSCLHAATITGMLDTVKFLINNMKSNASTRTPNGSMAMHLACEHGHIEILQYLSKLKECNIDLARDDGMTCLHIAVICRKVDIVNYLINDMRCNLNNKDHNLRTPLYLACEQGYLEVMKTLLAKDECDPNIKSDTGQNCLHVAVDKGDTSAVNCLLKSSKIMVNITNEEGFTPFFTACYLGNIQIVCTLLSCKSCNPRIKSKSNQDCLHAACASGNVKVVQFLVGNWTLMFDINGQDNEGVTALFLACKREHTEIVKYLLEKTSSDPNIKTFSEQTCLHAASASGNVKLVAYLSNMICVNTRDAEGTTPLHIACRAGHISVVQFFIDKQKSDFSILTNNGSSYLHEACASGKVEIIECIIDHCICHLNVKDCNGLTPLLIACQGNNLELVKYLITKGCERTCKTHDGRSCFHVACYYGNTDLVKFFASEYPKDDIESKDSFGITPMHLACQEGHIEIIKILFEQKHCDLKYQANNGRTCLHAAISTGKLEVVEYISSIHKTKMGFFYRLLHPFDSSALNDFGSSSVLHIAAELGQLNVVQYLIKHLKYDPNSKRPDQVLPIHLASFGGHCCVVDYLVDDCMCNIQSKDIYNNTPLHFAAAGGHTSMIKYLVEKYGYDINILLKTNSEAVTFQEDFCPYYLEKVHSSDIFQEGLRKSGTTPLHCASAYGHVNALQYLFDLTNCDPLIRDSNGDTLLHVATRNGQLDAVKHLVENQLIEYDVQGACKVTAVHVACFNGHLDILKYLIQDVIKDDNILKHGDEHQRTPLHYACAGGCLDVIKYIRLHVVCDTNSMLDKDGNSPLHLAVIHGKLQAVDLLMGSSVADRKYIPRMFDLSTKNLKEKNPIDLARAEANCDVYQYFLNEETKDAALKAPDSLSLTSSLSILVIGSSKSGKSTLIEALSTSRKFGWLNFIPITGVEPNTLRTVSHTVSHKEFGCITFYDMAGEERFHAGHKVILQQIHHPLVFVVVSLTQEAEDIGIQLAYWFKLISDAGTCSRDVFNVIIVGSHSDAPAGSDKMSNINTKIKVYIDNDAYCCKGLICCDCRYPGSESMKSLQNLIASVQNEMCSTQNKFECTEKLLYHTLFRYLQYLSRNRVSITLQELISIAKTIENPNANMRMLYDINILNSTCEYLHKLHGILYFQHDNVFIEKSVIILDEDLLLKLINNYLMASLEKFKDGVVEESQLKNSICELFSPKMFDTELAVKYLHFSSFCSEITYNKLSAIKQLKADSKYYVFPELISKDISRPDNLWDVSGEETMLWSVWCLQSEKNKFFTPELLHALFIKVINRDKDVDNLTLWSNGIALLHGNGTRSLIEVTDLTTKIYVVIQCKENCKLQLVKQRSVFCTMIKSLVKTTCCDVKYSESILYMDQNVYPPKNFKEISISKIADALVKDVESVVLHDNSVVYVSKFLYKDFFKEAKIQVSFQLFQNRTSDTTIPEGMQSRLYNLFKDQFQTDFGDRPLSYKDLYNRAITFSLFTDSSIFVSCQLT